MKLYYSPGACSLAVHILLEEVGAPYDVQVVALTKGEHLVPEYLEVNPRARVPSLEVDGEVLTEVPALLSFLADRYPEKKLLAAPGTMARARAQEFASWLASTVHIAVATIWRAPRFIGDAAEPTPLREKGRETLEACFAEIEARIADPFILPGEFSIIDAYAAVFYRWGGRLGIDMRAAYPRWTAWAERIAQRPSVRRALEREGLTLWDKPA